MKNRSITARYQLKFDIIQKWSNNKNNSKDLNSQNLTNKIYRKKAWQSTILIFAELRIKWTE